MKICSENNRRICGAGKELRVCYLLAGYPSCQGVPELLRRAEAGTPDIWEIGFPSNDPCADGDVICRAHAMVDHAAACAPEYWHTLRQATGKPVWMMGYHRDLVLGGVWLPFARQGLIDALVVPDCSSRERLRLRDEAAALGVDVLGFVDPKLDEAEVPQVLDAYPLAYIQLYSGKTGATEIPDLAGEMARRVCGRGGAKTFAGFGIRTSQRVHQLFDLGFTGAIIGTEVIRRLNVSPSEMERYLTEIGR